MHIHARKTHTRTLRTNTILFFYFYIFTFLIIAYTTASEQHVVGAGFVYRGTVRTSRDACDYI